MEIMVPMRACRAFPVAETPSASVGSYPHATMAKAEIKPAELSPRSLRKLKARHAKRLATGAKPSAEIIAARDNPFWWRDSAKVSPTSKDANVYGVVLVRDINKPGEHAYRVTWTAVAQWPNTFKFWRKIEPDERMI